MSPPANPVAMVRDLTRPVRPSRDAVSDVLFVKRQQGIAAAPLMSRDIFTPSPPAPRSDARRGRAAISTTDIVCGAGSLCSGVAGAGLRGCPGVSHRTIEPVFGIRGVE